VKSQFVELSRRLAQSGELPKFYSDEGSRWELVFLDITATVDSSERRWLNWWLKWLRPINIPFTVGGGIFHGGRCESATKCRADRFLLIQQRWKILRSSIEMAAHVCVRRVVVVGIDIVSVGWDWFLLHTHGGRKATLLRDPSLRHRNVCGIVVLERFWLTSMDMTARSRLCNEILAEIFRLLIYFQ